MPMLLCETNTLRFARSACRFLQTAKRSLSSVRFGSLSSADVLRGACVRLRLAEELRF